MSARDLGRLTTEQVNPDCAHIDELSTLDALRAINEQDRGVARAVESVLPELAELVDGVAARIADGGRLIYVGAGTSGRLGVLDASECPPTYGVSPETVQGVLAGGPEAFWRAKEGTEDRADLGARDMVELGVGAHDAVVGIAASGRTPYVIGALDEARARGALTGALSCVEGAELSAHADHAVECVTGPEAICGSTRMKAGTAQKMMLNMISTEAMVKLGKVYGNLMVDMRPTNEKLRDRARRTIVRATGCSDGRAEKALAESGNVKVAICMILLDRSAETCRAELEAHGGRISAVMECHARDANHA